jgi:uncharacterized membrane protein SpoIIM required for sporulation
MFEMLINPKKAERRPWEMFFVGMFYAALSVLLVKIVFSQDAVLRQYSGILVVTFMVLFSLPFIYFTIRLEEKKITPRLSSWQLIKTHRNALYAFMWLFLGFVVALSIAYIFMSSTESFSAQIETYCLINRPGNFDQCVKQYGIKDSSFSTGFLSNKERLFLIFTNNIYVTIFTLLFSLIFGAGVIFILAWNASVIAAAIGIFTDSQLSALPIGLARYMIHGVPEIGAYFMVALAGGMVSVSVIKHEFNTPKFWEVLHDSINLIILAVVVLFLAALVEVFITPIIF